MHQNCLLFVCLFFQILHKLKAAALSREFVCEMRYEIPTGTLIYDSNQRVTRVVLLYLSHDIMCGYCIT